MCMKQPPCTSKKPICLMVILSEDDLFARQSFFHLHICCALYRAILPAVIVPTFRFAFQCVSGPVFKKLSDAVDKGKKSKTFVCLSPSVAHLASSRETGKQLYLIRQRSLFCSQFCLPLTCCMFSRHPAAI